MIRLQAAAYAKINLYLDITGRRSDGYHLLETVMQSVSLHDTVTVELSGGQGITVRCGREDIPTDSRNTAYKAADLFMQKTGKTCHADISIEKNIPSGAGMGGGSADAAAVLYLMNIAEGEPLSVAALTELAAKVGADVPFCCVGGTKLCCGIGEEISDIPGLAEPPLRYYAVVKPDFSCPTGAAYAEYDRCRLAPHGRLDSFMQGLAEDSFAGEMYNVFQELYADERIAAVCDKLKSLGAENAMLTGSGSAVFGVFGTAAAARAAAESFPADWFSQYCIPAGEHGVELKLMEGERL